MRDYGSGIPEENLDRIFERFYRGVSVAIASAPGAGIGLSVVKELVDQLHGTIKVSSQEGEGSEFVVTLPVRHPKAIETADRVATAADR